MVVLLHNVLRELIIFSLSLRHVWYATLMGVKVVVTTPAHSRKHDGKIDTEEKRKHHHTFISKNSVLVIKIILVILSSRGFNGENHLPKKPLEGLEGWALDRIPSNDSQNKTKIIFQGTWRLQLEL